MEDKLQELQVNDGGELSAEKTAQDTQTEQRAEVGGDETIYNKYKEGYKAPSEKIDLPDGGAERESVNMTVDENGEQSVAYAPAFDPSDRSAHVLAWLSLALGAVGGLSMGLVPSILGVAAGVVAKLKGSKEGVGTAGLILSSVMAVLNVVVILLQCR